LQQKQALILERRKTASQTRLQKESIGKVMEEIRSNANKAQKLITQALSGKVTLASLQNSATKKGKRPKSSSGRMNKSKTTGELLNLNNTAPARGGSAGNGDSSELNNVVVKKQYGTNNDEHVQAYVSPYTGDEGK